MKKWAFTIIMAFVKKMLCLCLWFMKFDRTGGCCAISIIVDEHGAESLYCTLDEDHCDDHIFGFGKHGIFFVRSTYYKKIMSDVGGE